MHQHQAGGSHELDRKVPITDRIETVGVDGVKAQLGGGLAPIDGHRRARQGRGPQGTDIHPAAHVCQTGPVPLGHLDVSQ